MLMWRFNDFLHTCLLLNLTLMYSMFFYVSWTVQMNAQIKHTLSGLSFWHQCHRLHCHPDTPIFLHPFSPDKPFISHPPLSLLPVSDLLYLLSSLVDRLSLRRQRLPLKAGFKVEPCREEKNKARTNSCSLWTHTMVHTIPSKLYTIIYKDGKSVKHLQMKGILVNVLFFERFLNFPEHLYRCYTHLNKTQTFTLDYLM